MFLCGEANVVPFVIKMPDIVWVSEIHLTSSVDGRFCRYEKMLIVLEENL